MRKHPGKQQSLLPTYPYITLTAVAAALSVNLLIDATLGSKLLFFLFLVAAFIATRYEGWRAGLLATGLTTIGILYFFVDPIHSFTVAETYEWVRLGTFVVVSIATIVATLWNQRVLNRNS